MSATNSIYIACAWYLPPQNSRNVVTLLELSLPLGWRLEHVDRN